MASLPGSALITLRNAAEDEGHIQRANERRPCCHPETASEANASASDHGVEFYGCWQTVDSLTD